MGRFLDRGVGRLTGTAILTDDPFRARMLTAHHLDNGVKFYESRGMVGFSGNYEGKAAHVVSVGYGEASVLVYLQEILEKGVERILYLGECVSRSRSLELRKIVLPLSVTGARGVCLADENLLRLATSAADRLNIQVQCLPVLTDDTLWLDEKQQRREEEGEAVDFATNAVYWMGRQKKIPAVSILTVSESLPGGQRIGDAERQSRFHDAARLAFETVASLKDC